LLAIIQTPMHTRTALLAMHQSKIKSDQSLGYQSGFSLPCARVRSLARLSGTKDVKKKTEPSNAASKFFATSTIPQT
jgi:hypothetical protein